MEGEINLYSLNLQQNNNLNISLPKVFTSLVFNGLIKYED